MTGTWPTVCLRALSRRALVAAIVVVTIVAGGASMTGCATVKPWQRGKLSRKVMSLDPDPDRHAVRRHVLRVREGSVGGLGGGGGGCGCN